MTKGEYRVGITFNPSNDDMVGQIKRQAADFIDLITLIDGTENTEVARLKALAQTEIESAAMWAVKAATKPHREGTK
jgi:acetolactate synthase small subunit